VVNRVPLILIIEENFNHGASSSSIVGLVVFLSEFGRGNFMRQFLLVGQVE